MAMPIVLWDIKGTIYIFGESATVNITSYCQLFWQTRLIYWMTLVKNIQKQQFSSFSTILIVI